MDSGESNLELKPKRASKLSLNKRKRERKLDNGNEDGKKERKRRRTRDLPIPSFSPLDDQCCPFEFQDEDCNRSNMSDKKRTEKSQLKKNSKMQNLTKANNKSVDEERIKHTRDANRSNNVEQLKSRGAGLSLTKKPTPIKSEELKTSCDYSGASTNEGNQYTDPIIIQSSKENESTNEAYDDSTVTSLDQATTMEDREHHKNLKKNDVVARQGQRQPLSPVKNKVDVKEENLQVCKEIDEIEILEGNQIPAKKDTPIQLQEANAKKDLSRSNSKQQSLSAFIKPKVEPKSDTMCYDLNSPSMKDFNVSNAKFLADNETMRKQKHDKLLQESKNNLKPKKNSKSKLKSKKCGLCTTCSCNRGGSLQALEDSAVNDYQNPLQMLADTEAGKERALINRLARLEKSASWFDSLCTKVSRELTRHRNKIKAKMQTVDLKNAPKFLRDVDMDEDTNFSASPFSESHVCNAVQKTFVFRKKAQPTLTQMLEDKSEPNKSESNFEQKLDLDRKLEVIIEEEKEEQEENGDEQNLRHDSESKDYLGKDLFEEYTKFCAVETQAPVENTYVESDIVDHSVSALKGKIRGLWDVSRMDEKQLNQSGLKETFHVQVASPSRNQSDVAEDCGLLELMQVFEDVDETFVETDDISGHHEGTNGYNDSITTMSQLSPNAKQTYSSIKAKVETDVVKIETLQRECPDWEENMRFAMNQSPEEVSVALANVRMKRERNRKAMEILQKQDSVMEVFELALQTSLDRRYEHQGSSSNHLDQR